MGKKSKQSSSVDFVALQRKLTRQFHNLDPKDPSVWPAAPKVLLCIAIALGTTLLAWMLHLKGYEEELQTYRQEEATLRQDYQTKLTKAVSLEGLKKQREQVQLYVTQLEKQLPSKAEIAALLSDINQAGLGRSLQFELFRPGAVVAKEYYAELPIAVRVSGNYHDMGAFASDIANLSRIVTINNISITPTSSETNPSGAKVTGSGSLVMDATARTFRYLDTEEVAAQKAASTKKGG